MRKPLIFLLALIAGCATDGPYWERIAEPRELKETRVHRVDSVPLGKYHAEVDGWAVRNQDGSCDIFILRRAQNPSCVEAHERKHCEGWDHPKYPVNFGCSAAPLMSLR